ncbi:MAG: PaaX family transcriptional regulator C-terminal domain-containing protein [Acidimicrobiales bacterium]
MAAPDRPLSARSVVASTLLGTDPPELPAAALVRVGALFDMGEGTIRTALSRMASGGELDRVDDGRYRLAGDLLTRAGIQSVSRAAAVTTWSGRWRQAIVLAGPRSASERSNLRRAMTRLRHGELRDGVWLRPDNLDPQRWPDAHDIVDEQCRWFAVSPDHDDDLAASLWDLDAWAGRATELRRSMVELVGRLDDGDPTALAPGFIVSAAVLRHFNSDPLLPRELQPRHWPGDRLRADYDRYDTAYRRLLGAYLREH